jgi:signal transduction histidine kinase
MNSADSSVVRSIVLIDDDADFLHVLKKRLQAQRAEFTTTGPLEIHTYSDPVEALVNVPADPICVIIIDYSMPGTTGLEWLPKLVNAGVGPVILLTNQNDVNVTAAAFRAGASDYLAKADVVAEDQRLGRAIREAVHRYRLETRNNTLTRELKLVNAELEAKNKHLRELSETAHRFVDDVAHDLRTPLTVIEQYASIIADGISGSVTDAQRNQLGIITTASHEMADMVDDFLDSSKIKAGSLSVDRESHTVKELLDSVAPMLGVRAQPKGISIDQSVAEGIAMFFGDLSKAARVLTNLAVNAIKVTPQGRPLKLWAKPTKTGDVQIGVTDEGPGMRTEDLKVIFDRFKQLSEPVLAGTKGFGLGLSIVKQLTWLNLGTIEVQSEPGKGSTFSFTLPANNLPRILSCYFESIELLDKTDDLRMLQISSSGDVDSSMLRRLISSFCYPMDLVLQSTEEKAVNAIGVCSDVEAWSNRIREASTQFHKSVGQQAPELEIKTSGPWMRDGDKAQLHTALLEALGARACYA